MATPRGAEHRDLEQRLRNVETGLQAFSTGVLRRRQLSVTEGDFAVSGGGSVIVQDGGSLVIEDPGTLTSRHPNGQVGIQFGAMTPNPPYLHGLMLRDDSGNLRVWFGQLDNGEFQAGIGGGVVNPLNKLFLNATDQVTLGNRTTTDITMVGGDMIWIDAGPGGAHFQAEGGTISVGQGLTTAVYLGHSTTASAANARLDADGRFYRSTSSARYKQDIADAVVDPDAVLSVRGRTFRGRDEVAEKGEDAPRHVGFVAEELDALGLTDFVDYDDEGRPDAIQYDRLSVGLLAVAQRQAEQINALTARLDALEAAS